MTPGWGWVRLKAIEWGAQAMIDRSAWARLTPLSHGGISLAIRL